MKLHRLRRKKGATLAEICVVLALVAIIGTSIVSFSALVQRRTNASAQNGAVLEDLSNVEATLKQWIMHFDNADYSFLVVNEKDASTYEVAPEGSILIAVSAEWLKTHATDIEVQKNATVRIGTKNVPVVASAISLDLDQHMLISENMVTLEISMLKEIRFQREKSPQTNRTLIRCTARYDTAEKTDQYAWLMFSTHAQGAVLKR